MARRPAKAKRAAKKPRSRAPSHLVRANRAISRLEDCILNCLSLAAADLDRPITEIFRGAASPIDEIIRKCGKKCYDLTPRQVYEKIGGKPVNKLRDFIQYVQ